MHAFARMEIKLQDTSCWTNAEAVIDPTVPTTCANYCNSNLDILFTSACSYLADQCWNGGCIYLIMLRRVKRKAPPQPCRAPGGEDADNMGWNRGSTPSEPGGSPTQDGKRTRKFGVISRPSLIYDSKDSADFEQEGGCCSSLDKETVSQGNTPTASIAPKPMQSHKPYNGSSATLPAHSCIRLSASCKTESLDCDISSQVRQFN